MRLRARRTNKSRLIATLAMLPTDSQDIEGGICEVSNETPVSQLRLLQCSRHADSTLLDERIIKLCGASRAGWKPSRIKVVITQLDRLKNPRVFRLRNHARFARIPQIGRP